MRVFIVFGVGLGNLGRSARKRVKAPHWIIQLNRRLKAISAQVTVVGTYGHTGNFVVQTSIEKLRVRNVMEQALRAPCAVLTIGELQALAKTLTKSRKVVRLPRYTPGAVIQVSGTPIRRTPSPTN